MTRTHIVVALALTAMVPAAIAANDSLTAASQGDICFSAGAAGYRLTARGAADYTIRIDSAAARPDLVFQVVDDPATADFVLFDEGERLTDCRSARTVRIDSKAAEPDLVIALSRDEAEGRARIYAQAPAFRAEDAAAMFAVLRKAPKKRVAANAR